MTNIIRLKGILRDIQFSHKIKDIEYNKANLIVQRRDGKEDVLNVRFKKFSNPYSDGQVVALEGNVRSYSRVISDHNKVDIYVFTYFDIPELNDDDTEIVNEFEIEGRICKMGELRTTQSGKQNIHFILANNLIIGDNEQKLNSYLPCIAWGNLAREIATLHVNNKVTIVGELHSREYAKTLPDGECEIRVAHELVVTGIEVEE